MRVHESSALTGQQLLKLLQEMDPEQLAKPVHFAHPSGDYWRTQLAREVTKVYDGHVAWCENHQKFQTLDENKVDAAEREMRGAMDEECGGVDGQLEYGHQPILDVLIIE